MLAELIDPLDAALADPEPLALLQHAAVFANVLTSGDMGQLDPGVFVRMLDEVDLPATDALLTVLRVLVPEVVPPRVGRSGLPEWLAGLSEARVAAAASIVDPMRDADNLLVEVRLAGGWSVTMVVLVDHNLGSVVKDAFPLPGPLAEVVEDMHRFSPTLAAVDEAPADVAARLRESLARAAAMDAPSVETETWPACRPLLDWVLRLVPAGGRGWRFESHTGDELEALGAQVLAEAAEPIGEAAREVVVTLLGVAAGTALHDPLRWSPTAVEVLLMDRLPGIAPADPEWRAQVPQALRAIVTYAHPRRGVPAEATRETLAAIEVWWPRSELGAADPARDGVPELRIRSVEREAGGRRALDLLTTAALPAAEALDLSRVPEDVRPAAAELGRLVDEAVMHLFRDRELLTVARRLIGRAFAADPAILRRARTLPPIAAAVTWIAAKANDRMSTSTVDRIFFGAGSAPPVRVRDLAEYFAVKGSPSTRAAPILAALGRSWAGGDARDLGDPALLTSARRAAMIRQRDLLRVFGD